MIDRRTLLVAAAAPPLAGCTVGRLGTPRELRVATFNIWHDAGNWPARLPLIVSALRDADADVIALEEVLEDAAKNLPNQARTLAEALGGYSSYFASVDAEGAPRRYGSALLTRLPVLEREYRKLEPLSDYRTALRVRVNAAGSPVDAVCTHLAWQPDAGPVRARQLADLLAWLPADDVPTVLMGDFNAPLTDSGLATLAPRFVNAALPRSVTTTLNPAKGHQPQIIDHIFAERGAFAVSEARLFGERALNGEYPSDHFGVCATVRLLRTAALR